MTANLVRSLQRSFDNVIEDRDTFNRACRAALVIQTALFVALFVLIWVRT
jgi:hypothetical protein